MNALKY